MHSPPTPAAHHPLPHVRGRLRICSASIVFEPSLDDVPLLRIPLNKVTCIEPVRASGWNVATPGAGGSEAKFRVQCSTLVSMLNDNKPGPYKVACRCVLPRPPAAPTTPPISPPLPSPAPPSRQPKTLACSAERSSTKQANRST